MDDRKQVRCKTVVKDADGKPQFEIHRMWFVVNDVIQYRSELSVWEVGTSPEYPFNVEPEMVEFLCQGLREAANTPDDVILAQAREAK